MQFFVTVLCSLACSTGTLALAGDVALVNPKTAPLAHATQPLSPGLLAPVSNDDCSNAKVVVGSGPHPFLTSGTYMLQIGGYSTGAAGSGTFQLLPPAPPPPPCLDYDDGSVENLLGFTAGGDIVWLNRFGTPGVQTTIVSVEVQWPVASGAPTNVVVWQDDPAQDGSPATSTIVLDIPTTISGSGSYVTFPAPLTITGIFFVGTHQLHSAGQFVAPIDQTSHTHIDCSWFFGSNVPGQPANLANPGANPAPPHSLDLALPGQFLVRVNCLGGPPNTLCDPGSGGTQVCPCANPPSSPGRGCNNSSNTGGASMSGAGLASVGASTLVFTTAGEKPTALSILLQGASVNSSGVVLGQGIRCAAGVLKRLYTHTAVGGSITAPSGTDLDIPTRSASLGDPILAGQSRWYLVYYRDATVLGGCSALATFNDTNTAEVLWAP